MFIFGGNQVESVIRMKGVRQHEMGAYLVSCKKVKKKKKIGALRLKIKMN